MPKLLIALSCCLLIGGCLTVDELTLTQAEANALVDHVETAVQAQHELTKFAFGVARGDVDIGPYTYDPPTAGNNWVGTLTVSDGVFPFGVGNLTMTFTATGDGGPVDPYAVDITDDTSVMVDVDVGFLGMHQGRSIDIGAVFSADATQNLPDDVVARVNGLFDIDYDGYIADIEATDLDVTIDVVLDEITSVVGQIDANIQIPNFAFDADLAIDGLGDQIDVGLRVVGTTINYLLDLAQLFGA